jgi:hypothetical protein
MFLLGESLSGGWDRRRIPLPERLRRPRYGSNRAPSRFPRARRDKPMPIYQH